MRDLLEKNFPLGTTETSAADIEQSMTVSAEGFRDVFNKLFGGGKVAKTDDTNGNMDWYRQHVIDGKVKDLQLRSAGHVLFGPRFAPFMGRGTTQVVDFVREAKKDLVMYQGLFNKYQPKAADNNRKLQKIETEAAQFLKRDTHPEGLDEFIKLMEKWDTWITPLNGLFRDPSHVFLGYGKTSFLSEGGMFAGGPGTLDKKKTLQSVKMSLLKEDEVNPLVGLIEQAALLMYRCSEVTEDAMGIDLTDPPFRGYYAEAIEARDEGFKAQFAHPDYEMINTDLFVDLNTRVGELMNAMVAYLKHSAV